ncbi:MAG: hypothetical protein WBG32_06590 [Nodosilinea sp.]
MTQHTRQSFQHWFFPPIVTKADARKVANQGFWAAIIVAVGTAVFAMLATTMGPIEGVPTNAWAFIDAGIFVAISLGIRKRSRIAAIAGLAMYWLELVVMWSTTEFQSGEANGLFMAALLTISFINGIRGTVAYHRLVKQPESDGNSTTDHPV